MVLKYIHGIYIPSLNTHNYYFFSKLECSELIDTLQQWIYRIIISISLQVVRIWNHNFDYIANNLCHLCLRCLLLIC